MIFPGVPNSTAVTQETDRNYGPFKHYFRDELDGLMRCRISKGLSLSMAPWMIGLLVFGRNEDPLSKYKVNVSPFEMGFNPSQNLKA